MTKTKFKKKGEGRKKAHVSRNLSDTPNFHFFQWFWKMD